jgi:hypothetical protein
LRLKAQAQTPFTLKLHQSSLGPIHTQALLIKHVHANGNSFKKSALSDSTTLHFIDGRSMQQINFKPLQICKVHIQESRWKSFGPLFDIHQWPSYPLYSRQSICSSLSDESWMLQAISSSY